MSYIDEDTFRFVSALEGLKDLNRNDYSSENIINKLVFSLNEMFEIARLNNAACLCGSDWSDMFEKFREQLVRFELKIRGKH